jgi:hypothetical protein
MSRLQTGYYEYRPRHSKLLSISVHVFREKMCVEQSQNFLSRNPLTRTNTQKNWIDKSGKRNPQFVTTYQTVQRWTKGTAGVDVLIVIFLDFRRKKIGAFSHKPNFQIIFLRNLALIWVKKTPFFVREYFFSIKTLIPGCETQSEVRVTRKNLAGWIKQGLTGRSGLGGFPARKSGLTG